MNEVEGNTFDGIKQNYSSATRRDMPYGEWVDLPCLFKHWASKYSCSVELQFWPVKMFPANRQTGPEACACSATHSDLPPNLCFRRHNNCLYLWHAKRGNPTKPQQVSRAIFAQSITLAKVRERARRPGRALEKRKNSQNCLESRLLTVLAKSGAHPEIRFYRGVALCLLQNSPIHRELAKDLWDKWKNGTDKIEI